MFQQPGTKKYRTRVKEEVYREGERYIFSGSRVQIAVVGAQERVGTTSVALGLANWLSESGGRACYVEGNLSGHMNYLTADYEMDPEDYGFVMDNVGYYQSQPERKAIVLCSFVDQALRTAYEEAFSTDYHRVLILEYQPNCFSGMANGFKTIIKPYIMRE